MSTSAPEANLGICFQNRQRGVSVDGARIRAALATVAACFEDIVPPGAEVTLVLVSARRIKELNRRFAGRNESTDVLSFPVFDDGLIPDEPGELGDVVVSVQHVERQAGVKDRRGHPRTHDFVEELVLLLVHGILHLVGFDHQGAEDQEEMIAQERLVLGRYRATVKGSP
jgi:probable rRNA maturation factor